MAEHTGIPRPTSPAELTSDSPYTLPGFFAALAAGELVAAVCADCDTRLIPPRTACYGCGGRDLTTAAEPHTGTVVSYTEVRTAPPAFADRVPYTVAIVELDSGAKLTGRLTAAYDDVAIDMPVRLVVRAPTAAEQELGLSYETEWPVHTFEPV
ncbi:MAG: Zn-ribbon domain-containing OB-fold protein [Haloquadratum sp.]|nr:Zn-ribbon domain-containing OB-fold protein [Haloquadratum sp.]